MVNSIINAAVVFALATLMLTLISVMYIAGLGMYCFSATQHYSPQLDAYTECKAHYTPDFIAELKTKLKPKYDYRGTND